MSEGEIRAVTVQTYGRRRIPGAEIDEYVTAFSLERRDERSFAMLTGVTG